MDNEIIVTWPKKRALHDLKVLEECYEKCKELIEKKGAQLMPLLNMVLDNF